MSLVLNDNFQRSGYAVIACHSPLVLDVTLTNANATQSSGDVTAKIQGQGLADNINAYTFDMGLVSSVGLAPTVHTFKLDITDIIRKVCNDPDLRNEVTTLFFTPSRLATLIRITIESASESDVVLDNNYMHGFNQVNDPDSSCLVDFANGDAVIPIVAGAPMLWSLWTHSIGASPIFRLMRGSTVVWDDALLIPNVVSLCQVYDTDLNLDLAADWEEGRFEYFFDCFYISTTLGKIDLVALTDVCEGAVLICWLNRYGTYSYMAFERFPTVKGEQKDMGDYDLEVYDIADLQSRTKNKGYSGVKDVITAIAKNVPTQYFPAIADLFYSMDVYYFTGTLPEETFDPTEWLRVKVKGTLKERKKFAHENVRIDITLPEKYTQIR